MPILARGLVLFALAGTAQAQVESIERGWRDESWPVRERGSEQAIDAWADWSVEDLARLEALRSDPDSEVADRAGKALARIRIRRELGAPLVLRGLDADVLAGESGGVAALDRAGKMWWNGDVAGEDVAGLLAWATRQTWAGTARRVCELAREYFELYEDLLWALLRHEAPGIRRAALQGLAGSSRRDRSPELVPLLADPSGPVRAKAVSLLGRLDSGRLADRIVVLLDDRDVADDLRDALHHRPNSEILGALLPLLDSTDPTRRAQVADLLGEGRSVEIAPAIRPLLLDPEPRVRRAGARVLANLDDREAVDALSRLVRDPDAGVRAAAIDALACLEARDRAGEIASTLADADTGVRRSAARALGELGERGAARRIGDCLEDPEPSVRAAAVGALELLRDPEADGRLVRLLDDPRPSLRVAAAEALFACGRLEHLSRIVAVWYADRDLSFEISIDVRDTLPPSCIDRAVPLLDDADRRVRCWAIDQIAGAHARQHAGAIAKLLEHRDAETRSEAVSALMTLRAREDRDRIAALLDDPDCVWSALDALTRLRVREAIPRIARLLDAEDARLRRAAVQALGKLAARERLLRIAELREDADEIVRQTAVEAIWAIDAEGSAGAIARFLRDPSPSVRLQALEALESMRAREQGEEIALRLEDPAEDVRDAAIRVLGRLGIFERSVLRIDGAAALEAIAALGPELARERILSALGDENPSIRVRALGLLAPMARPEDAAIVLPFLRAGNPALRGQVPAILARTGAVGLSGELLPLLEDRDWAVRRATANALRELAFRDLAGALGRLVASDEVSIRNFAVQELAFEGAAAEAWLVPFLRDPSAEVVRTACWALARIEARQRVAEIEALLDHGSPRVRAQAAESMAILDASRLGPQVDRLLHDPEEEVRCAAAGLLRDASPRLLSLLDDPSPRVQAAAIRAVGARGAREHAGRIAAFVALEREPIVQAAAVEALRELGAKGHGSCLVAVLAARDERTAAPAAEGLADLGEASAAPALRDLIRHPGAGGRAEAMASLVRLEGAGSTEFLCELLHDEIASAAALRLAEAAGGLPPERLESVVAALEELALYCPDRVAASIALARLGREGPIPISKLLNESGWLHEVLDALAQRCGGRGWAAYAGEVELESDIRTVEDLVGFFAARGLTLEGADSLPAIRPAAAGIRISPRLALARCLDRRAVAVLDGSVVRIVPRQAAVAGWRARLEGR